MVSDEPISRAKFLVLSGDSVTRDLIAVLLKNRGYRDTVAADPNEGDEVLRSQEFLAVFADARPMYSAADFQALMARLGKDTKLVLLVDENGIGVISEAMAGKADTILAQPFDDAMVDRVLRRLTGGRKATAGQHESAGRRRGA